MPFTTLTLPPFVTEYVTFTGSKPPDRVFVNTAESPTTNSVCDVDTSNRSLSATLIVFVWVRELPSLSEAVIVTTYSPFSLGVSTALLFCEGIVTFSP